MFDKDKAKRDKLKAIVRDANENMKRIIEHELQPLADRMKAARNAGDQAAFIAARDEYNAWDEERKTANRARIRAEQDLYKLDWPKRKL